MIDARAVVGVCSTYAELRAALKVRVSELRLTHLDVDEIAGLQGGYTGKILCGTRHLGDTSLGPLLGALGLKLVLMRSRASHKEKDQEHLGPQADLLKKTLSDFGRKGGRARVGRQTNEERSSSARKAANSRWRAIRAAKAERERKARRKAEKQ